MRITKVSKSQTGTAMRKMSDGGSFGPQGLKPLGADASYGGDESPPCQNETKASKSQTGTAVKKMPDGGSSLKPVPRETTAGINPRPTKARAHRLEPVRRKTTVGMNPPPYKGKGTQAEACLRQAGLCRADPTKAKATTINLMR